MFVRSDLPSGLCRETTDALLRLRELQRCRPAVTVLEGAATTGGGVDEVLAWMVANHVALAS